MNGVNYALRLGVAGDEAGDAGACDAGATRNAVVHRAFSGALTLLSLDGGAALA